MRFVLKKRGPQGQYDNSKYLNQPTKQYNLIRACALIHSTVSSNPMTANTQI